MSHPAQKKETAESLQSKPHQLILKKGQVSSENHFRERIKQWIFPNKAKDQNSPCKKASLLQTLPRAREQSKEVRFWTSRLLRLRLS